MMEQPMKRKCVVVNADKHTLQQLKQAASIWYHVLDTPDAEKAIQLMETHPDVSVFIAQHDRDDFDCVGLLERVRASYPDVRRIVMTSYLEIGRIIPGLHNGTIQKLIQKPINVRELQRAIVPFEAHAAAVAPGPQKLAG
jgi:response regulator RpfG family c-di-GMP phosphodiesterase